MNLAIDAQRRRVRLDPRDPDFFSDPYPPTPRSAKQRRHSSGRNTASGASLPIADVSALLRDRRFGRQILHVMSRAELGWPEPKPHLQPFDALERHSILELSRPGTRGSGASSIAPSSRAASKNSRREIAALAHERIDAFAQNRSAELIAEFAGPIPVAVIADLLGAPRDMGP